MVYTRPSVYSRPNKSSFDWCTYRRGIKVEVSRRSDNGFSLVTYREYDDFYNPQYITYEMTGWVEDSSLAYCINREYFLVKTSACEKDSWEIFTDNHTFQLFWADINDLPQVVTPQDQWLRFLMKKLKNDFEYN